MKIAVGCDHGGFPLKESILSEIRDAGHEPLDFGTDSLSPVDYPDFVVKVGAAIQSGDAQRGILICGSGIGASIAANKMDGIYAGVCHDTYSAHQGVEHDDMNVLVLGARVIGVEMARELVDNFLAAKFCGEERHRRRVEKIAALERRYGK